MKEDFESLTPDQEKVRKTLRSLATSADPAYRERLKQVFVAGTIEPAASPAAARPRGVFGWASTLDWLRGSLWGGLATAAAAAAAVMAIFAFNHGPPWELVATSGQGVAVVDGHEVSMRDARALAGALRPGVRVSVPAGASIELHSPGHLALFLESSTVASVPAVPGRWFARSSQAEVEAGIMRIVTGPGFHGARLSIATPVADVEITGTTLAVICEPAGTCVCVLEGSVRMSEKGAEPVPIHEGMRRYVFGDGRAPESAKMRDMEVEKLTMFRAQVREGR